MAHAGQAIAIAMPMTMEAVVAYFGIVLAGCAAVSIADSFAAAEMASRLRIANAAGVVTQVHAVCAAPLHAMLLVCESQQPGSVALAVEAVWG